MLSRWQIDLPACLPACLHEHGCVGHNDKPAMPHIQDGVQAFTNCEQIYKRARNVHISSTDLEHNSELLLAQPHIFLCFKKIRATTATTLLFPTQSRILTAIVQHSILNLLHPYLKFQVFLIDITQSDIQILYGLQIDNGIPQSVNSS